MLHYTKTGTGNEALVLLHGFMENNTIWQEMEPLLKDKFSLIKIDLLGHGKSPNQASVHTMEMMAEAVKEVVQSENIAQFHLLGHSMGGYVSLAYAEKYAEDLKSLTLFFSTFLEDSEEKKEMRKKSFRVVRESMNTYINAGVPLLFSALEREKLESKITLAKEIALSTAPENVIAALEGMMLRPNRFSVVDTLKGKVMFILGKHDNAVNASEVMKQIPMKENIKTYILDCGHNGHWEKPIVCSSILIEELS